jgi:hypothetical protein
MKKTLTVFLFVTHIGAVSAQTFHEWDNPSRKFPIENAQFQTKIVATDAVQKVCERESKNRGFSGFNYAVNSCAFWNDAKTECTIVVPKNTSMHLLGHELLHCIKGNWH